jgi:hypothetical protein
MPAQNQGAVIIGAVCVPLGGGVWVCGVCVPLGVCGCVGCVFPRGCVGCVFPWGCVGVWGVCSLGGV